MKFTKEILYYDCLANFKAEFYKRLLTQENLVGTEIKLNKLDFPDGGTKDKANFWGWELEKSGIKYLLPSRTDTGDVINVHTLLPFIAEDLEKVANKGVVYYLIRRPITARLKPIKSMTFKELIDTLSALEHSNPMHQKLWVMMGFTSMTDRANFRLSTPPGFGKDSIVDTFGCLVGSAATIENPTLAKLEFMTMYKWLVVNEINDIPKAEWKIIEQFLLAVGAHKPESTKHSRSGKTNVKEVMDLKDFSISLTYNDITDYKDPKEYIDFVSKSAVLDRFPAFRLHGSLTEDFNKVVDVPKIVKDNFETYKEIAYNIMYYKVNKSKELKRFKVNGLDITKSRWKTNIGRLLQVVDMYCSTQEEFDIWVTLINNSLKDYEAMVQYKFLVEDLEKSGKKITKEAYCLNTFLEKNLAINNLMQGNVVKDNLKLWS